MFNEASSSTPIAIRTAINEHIRSVAIIDYLDDFGIGGYIYELAEGLAANGVSVDVYSCGQGEMSKLAFERHHRFLTVLGNPLYKQKELLRRAVVSQQASRAPQSPTSTSPDNGIAGNTGRNASGIRRLKDRLRSFLLPL